MARLHLTVEGPTERQFAVNLLQQFLANCGVYLGRIELSRPCKEEQRSPSWRSEAIFAV